LRPLAVTMGEPAGIGPEVFAKAAADPAISGRVPLVWCGDPEVLRQAVAQAGTGHLLRAVTASDIEALTPAAGTLFMLPVERDGTAAVVAAIDTAVALASRGACSGVVTSPIAKKRLQDAGFGFPGHTEYLAHLTGAPRAVMMLAIEGLRVVPVTVHMALKDVAASLSEDAIVATGRITAQALARDFAIAGPRLAVAGLNPHAGEGGAMGREEIEIIAPAIARLRAEGIAASGPFPADTLFHARARAAYDAALCMYHDQALIPLKTLDFDRGVNVTLGLPVVRTSPDHGTAFDIAGRNLASPASMIAAILMAAAMAR
jgi:4-hydroxythreonine-4-phosphate dehydrogenase